MAEYNANVGDNHRIFMIDFERAPVSPTVPVAERRHPHKSCPDIDTLGYMDDAHADEHGPVISARVGGGNVRVVLARTEISNSAQIYAVSADPSVARVVWPNRGLLSHFRKCIISISPQAAGRTSIDIRYLWPDGPVIGRLYVVVRDTQTVRVRVHMVTVNGNGQGASFLGRTAVGVETPAQHLTNRVTEIIRDANHVLEPHGILLSVSETVNTAWINASFPPAGDAYLRCMQAMAQSPNRSAARINLYLVNGAVVPFALGFVALGPPIAWAIAIGARWPNAPGGNVGNGIIVDTSAAPFTGPILAHEFAHVFSLSRIITVGANVGAVLQWHTPGDQAGAGGNTHGTSSRDDIITRRRLMYPYTTLSGSNNAWRTDVGYGNNMGSMIIHRQVTQDITLDESQRAYDFTGTAANIYAP
ncbi:MAG: hypothetical protein NTU53_18885 [Planctomycetota bacterium]|nr:hypothetical protein [Planctomycetota bacterium]